MDPNLTPQAAPQPAPQPMPQPTGHQAPAQPPAPDLDVQQVKSMLDLPETASDIEVITVLVNLVAALQEKYEALLSDAVALEDNMTNRDLEDYSDIIPEGQRGYWKEQIIQNRSAAIETLNGLRDRIGSNNKQETAKQDPPPQQPPSEPEPIIPLRNRMQAINRSVDKVAQPTESPLAADPVAIKIRNRAHQIAKDEKVPFIIAFSRAESEISTPNE